MLQYNEVKPRKVILYEAEPWQVIENQVSRKQQNKPVNKAKIKNLISGRVIEATFRSSDTVHEADLERRALTYLYTNPKNGELWFADADNPKDRFTLIEDVVGDEIKFIKEKEQIDAYVFNHDDTEKIIGLKYPTKVTLEVTEAPPNIKGDTATGGRKVVVVETGASVNAPLFVNTGDLIIVNTETGEYSERAEKN